jgi:hypothetical protein
MFEGDTTYSAQAEKAKKFSELRKAVHQTIDLATEKRLKENPVPTEEEIMIGAFAEMLEPQVREAIFIFFKKGYPTESSGFAGDTGEIQQIDGYFSLDETTKQQLKSLGAEVHQGPTKELPGKAMTETSIRFYPSEPNLELIKQIWDQIAAILPDKNSLPQPSISGASEEFRQQYAPERTDLEKIALTHLLELVELHPDTVEKIKKRLKELKN